MIIKILAFKMDLSITDLFLNKGMFDINYIFNGKNNKIISTKFV